MENPSACGERGMEVQSKHYTYSIHTDAGHTHAHRTLPEPEHEACAAVLYVYRRRRVSVSVVHTRVKREACTDPILPVCICLPPVCVCVVWENKRVLNVQTQMRGTQKKKTKERKTYSGVKATTRAALAVPCVCEPFNEPAKFVYETPPSSLHQRWYARTIVVVVVVPRARFSSPTRRIILYTRHTQNSTYILSIYFRCFMCTQRQRKIRI